MSTKKLSTSDVLSCYCSFIEHQISLANEMLSDSLYENIKDYLDGRLSAFEDVLYLLKHYNNA